MRTHDSETARALRAARKVGRAYDRAFESTVKVARACTLDERRVRELALEAARRESVRALLAQGTGALAAHQASAHEHMDWPA